MTPALQVAAVLVILVFGGLIAAGLWSETRRPARMRRVRTATGSLPVTGDRRAGGEQFREEALAAADDPITTSQQARRRNQS